jgi:hypothetical protein
LRKRDGARDRGEAAKQRNDVTARRQQRMRIGVKGVVAGTPLRMASRSAAIDAGPGAGLVMGLSHL